MKLARDDTSVQDRVDALLAQYEELVEAGTAPTIAAFAARHPEHPELAAALAALERLRHDLDGLAANASAQPPRDTIAGYSLEAPLGDGGMGVVYRARGADGGAVALKLLRHATPTAQRRFEREAALAMTLTHPGIVRVLAYGDDSGIGYLVTELVPGRPLDALIAAKRDHRELFAVGQAVAIARAVAAALGHAHARGVIHRDVKPGNIIIDDHGEPHLIDFGLAVRPAHAGTRVTRTGLFVGSYSYAAPEQLRGDKDALGPWSDTYALAATLFELLTLQPPFAARDGSRGSAAARLADPAAMPTRRPRALRPDLPAPLDRFLWRALDSKAKRRFADGGSMAAALAALPIDPDAR